MEALASLRLADLYGKSEVIVVDNASGDNSRELITANFPEVQWIQLKTNIGFGKACNVGAASASGKFLLFLNPDTVISRATLKNSVEFMEANPQAGLMGPKILNTNGTLQLSCRRSNPTPSVAFYYFSGLSRLFPKSKRFGRYNLTYMDENETAQVDVVSGSFMFMKLEFFRVIGGFDERFFMYGEDIDLCFRVRQQGYEVWYYPVVQIVHLKGKSSAKRQIRSRFYFYEAMVIYSRKHREIQDSFFPRWLMWLGIAFQAALNIGITLVRSAAASLFDAAVINTALWGGLNLWFSYRGYASLYTKESIGQILSLHGFATMVFLFTFVYNGLYSVRHYSAKNVFFSGLLSSSLFMSGVYFFTPYASFGFAAGLIAAVFLTVGWRGVLMRLKKPLKKGASKEHALVPTS
jgi:GT2 family glycosyltransferase